MYTYGHTLSLPDALPIFRPRRDELFGLAQHRVDAAADEFSAQIGDDAEGAAVVAAFGNLEVAVMPRGQFQPALGDEIDERSLRRRRRVVDGISDLFLLMRAGEREEGRATFAKDLGRMDDDR